MDLGIEAAFLATIGAIEAAETPKDGDLVEQGYVGFRLTTADKELHSVFIPLSGQVVEVNPQVVEAPATLDGESWLVRVIPTRLESELALLKERARRV